MLRLSLLEVGLDIAGIVACDDVILSEIQICDPDVLMIGQIIIFVLNIRA
jgi:hypothetical protein